VVPELRRLEPARARDAALTEVSPELVLVDPVLAERELARLNTATLFDDLLQEVNRLVDRALEETLELPGLDSNRQLFG
jgi:hypothetical protein